MDTSEVNSGSVNGKIRAELALTLFVVLVSGVAILGTFLSAHTLTLRARETSTALTDLQVIMQQIRETPYAILPQVFPDGVPDGGLVNDYGRLVGGYRLENQRITVTYPYHTASLVEITATLTWSQGGKENSLSLATIRSSS